MLKDSFCSSPWFHFRINPAGYYVPCRWASEWLPQDGVTDYHIRDYTPVEYMNSQVMCQLRSEFLQGQKPQQCQGCYYEDSHNKVSGRHKQLLKSAIQYSNFEKTLASSPHWADFEYSLNNQGQTVHSLTDIQIDLGNTCNSACIMCNPTYSSKLAVDYKKLTARSPELFPVYAPVKNWADDPVLLDKFVDCLVTIKGIKYIHFLGGEPLYMESFYTICERLIQAGISQDIIIGTTTNGTVYSSRLQKIINNFAEFHLGFSIETLDSVNDYVRYPGRISQIKNNLTLFLADEHRLDGRLQLTLRITPTVLTITRLPALLSFMLENSVIAESCNILSDPACLRLELVPDYIRKNVIRSINELILAYNLEPGDIIINRRRRDLKQQVINNLVFEYRYLLENIQAPQDVEQQRYNLVEFLKSWESIRHNSILDSLPEYEEFLRSYGY